MIIPDNSNIIANIRTLDKIFISATLICSATNALSKPLMEETKILNF